MAGLVLKKLPLLTPEQYLMRESMAVERSEYHQGLVLAMAGTSDNHMSIVGNLYMLMRNALPSSKCRVTTSELKVVTPANTSFFYPDLVVRCDQKIPGHKDTTATPSLIVEVLSPSTRGYDLETKRLAYYTIPSLHTLLYVDSAKRQVILYERAPKGKWPSSPSRPTRAIALKNLGIALPISDLYENTDL
jgi:Uma2 family endonuclease